MGEKVSRWTVGDEVVVHCNQDDGEDEECNGGDPMFSPSQRIWGYETPDGSFAQFTRVQAQQVMPRPRHLTWEESGCYMLTLATAYRMLFGHRPHVLKPGHNVLVWGASGGLGSMAVQLTAAAGANAIGVISDDDKRDFVISLGAKGAINRTDFDCWGPLPDVKDATEYGAYMKKCRAFGKAIWGVTGKGVEKVSDLPLGDKKIGERAHETVETVQDKIDVEQIQEQVARLRDQIENVLGTWKESFRPAAGQDADLKTTNNNVQIGRAHV